jgi:hypothetical protein
MLVCVCLEERRDKRAVESSEVKWNEILVHRSPHTETAYVRTTYYKLHLRHAE